MPHPLQTKVATVSRRARRLISVHAASRVLAMILGSVLVLASLDYLFRYRDRGVRIICTVALLASVAWAIYRFLIPLLRRGQNDLATARRIESRFPLLGDRLSSAIQFLSEDANDPQAGSSALRQAVIVETTAQSEPLEFDDALDRRPIWKALAVSAAICVVAALAWSADPAAARMGTIRLLNPLGDTVWPRETQLAFVTPVTQIALGDTFEVALVNRNGSLPRDVQILFRHETDGPSWAQDNLPIVGGKMVVRRENIREAFEYRAVGGDDTMMPWIAVSVVEPPRIEALDIHVIPPKYTGLASRKSEPSIRALRGARIALRAEVDHPLRSAALLLSGGRRIPATLDADGRRFSIAPDQSDAWIIADDRAYWFELVDRDDVSLVGGGLAKWEIRPITDNRPTVELQQPSVANLYVTRDAVVPVRVIVQDDLAIRSVALKFTLTDPSLEQEPESDRQEHSVSLHQGPPSVLSPKVKQQQDDPKGEHTASGQTRTFAYSWSLAELDLRPGMHIDYRVTASDYQPMTAESLSRRLLIITTEQLESRITDRQSTIVSELARVLKIERQSRTHVASLEIQLRQMGRLTKQDIDRLQAARFSQRQATRVLAAKGEGLTAQIEAMLDELLTNRVDSAESVERLTSLLNHIKRLDVGPLSKIEHQLTQALNGAQASLNQSPGSAEAQTDRPIAAAIGMVAKEQDLVIRSLEEMLAQWSQWNSYHRLGRDWSEIRRQQEELTRIASEMSRDPKILGRRRDELTAQQQADLDKFAARQLLLARDFDAVETRMEQHSEKLRSENPSVAGLISDALDISRTKTISGRMRQSGRQIADNRIGQAQGIQQQVEADLQEIFDVLLNRREQDLARLIRKLQQAETDLDEIRRKQQGLAKKTRQAKQISDAETQQHQLRKLTRQQREIANDVRRLTRELRRLESRRAAETLDKASRRMDQTQQKRHKEIEKDLEQARQQLADRRAEAQADLMREQMIQLSSLLADLIKRQQSVIEQTRHLDTTRKRADASNWHKRVDRLVRQQRLIDTDLRNAADRLTTSSVFTHALQNISFDIAQAVELLTQYETGSKTVMAQQRALDRMARIVEALNPKSPEEEIEPPNNEPPKDDAQSPQAGAGQPRMVEELVLLLVMQRDVNRRTITMEQSRSENGIVTEEQKAKFDRLSGEQGRIADLFEDLIPQPKPKSENDANENRFDPNTRNHDRTGQDDSSLGSLDAQLLDDLADNLLDPLAPPSADDEQSADEADTDTGTKDAPAEDEKPPTERIGDAMRQSEKRVAQYDSGGDTQKVQQQIVDDMEEIIRQTRRRRSKKPGDGSGKPQQPNGQDKEPSKSDLENGAGDLNDKTPARESTERIGHNPSDLADIGRLRSLLDGPWGNLPEKERQARIQGFRDHFLPQYEIEIERYYQRLIREQEQSP